MNDHPNDPMERIPFIEAYAHTGRVENALEQTQKALETTPLMNDPLCALWQRIGRESGMHPEELDEISRKLLPEIRTDVSAAAVYIEC